MPADSKWKVIFEGDQCRQRIMAKTVIWNWGKCLLFPWLLTILTNFPLKQEYFNYVCDVIDMIQYFFTLYEGFAKTDSEVVSG